MAIDGVDPVTSVAKALLKADGFGQAVVIVEDLEGTITLKGTVASEHDKLAVGALVEAQEGVVEVDNQLKIYGL